MKRRTVMIAVMVLTGAAVFWFAYHALRDMPADKIRIGAVISLSGPAAHLVDVRDGMALAISEVNRWGGINGKEVELIVRDSRSDPDHAKKAFEEIEKESRPLLYVATNSAVAMQLAPLAEQSGVVTLGLVVSATAFARQNPWCYRYYALAQDEARAILFVLKRLKVRSLGIVFMDDEFGTEVAAALKNGFEGPQTRVTPVSFGAANPDWEGLVPRVADMEAVCVVGFANHEARAIAAFKAARYAGHLLGASGAAALAGDPMMDGVYVATPMIYSDNFIFAREAKQKFAAAYGRPLTHQAASGYDFVKLLAGLLDGREVSRPGLRELLEQGLVYPGIFGEVELEPGRRDIPLPLHPARIVDGRIEFLR